MIINKILMAALLILVSYNASSSTFIDNGDGTVTDFATGLMWQQSDDHNNIERTQSAATGYCNSLTLAGGAWRLPTVKELFSIVDFRRTYPSINLSYFPDASSWFYWSSSGYENDSGSAWLVGLETGSSTDDDTTNAYYVRCVRG